MVSGVGFFTELRATRVPGSPFSQSIPREQISRVE
jgi:hypothetical protein